MSIFAPEIQKTLEEMKGRSFEEKFRLYHGALFKKSRLFYVLFIPFLIFFIHRCLEAWRFPLDVVLLFVVIFYAPSLNWKSKGGSTNTRSTGDDTNYSSRSSSYSSFDRYDASSTTYTSSNNNLFGR